LCADCDEAFGSVATKLPLYNACCSDERHMFLSLWAVNCFSNSVVLNSLWSHTALMIGKMHVHALTHTHTHTGCPYRRNLSPVSVLLTY
jgi:hypothetical protein